MIDELMNDAEKRMEGVIAATKRDFAGIRTGRAHPSLVERIEVEYYGTMTPLNQLASISVPEPRTIVIQPWDQSAIKDIEKAILQSDLGLTPSNDGSIIRIQLPQLTEERRKELVRLVRKEAEERRVSIRNIRRQTNDDIKNLEKNGEVSEDDLRRAQTLVQELTDRYIKKIDELLEVKEKEIMEV